MKLKKITLGLIAFCLAVSAQAGVYSNDEYIDSIDDTQYVRVVRSEPVYENISQQVPYQQCWNEQVPVQTTSGSRENSTVGTVIGGVAGGVLGHQVGGGRGKTAATIGGAILGSVIGNNIGGRDTRHTRTHYETRRVCDTKYRTRNKRVLTGYNNIGYYNGRKIVKFSEERLRNIPVTTTISY